MFEARQAQMERKIRRLGLFFLEKLYDTDAAFVSLRTATALIVEIYM